MRYYSVMSGGFKDIWLSVLENFIFLGTYFIYWAPWVFGFALYKLWQYYVQRKYIANIKWTLLEIHLPREIRKTPLAMEVVLSSLYQSAGGTWYDQMFKGKVKDWFSLELVSLGGDVKFFVRTPDVYKNVIESQIYGQYPNAEVIEVPDYARYVDYTDGKEWDMFGSEFVLLKEDALPIKTYVDFGLDREGVKDEEKVDPLTATIEYLGTMNPGEQMWVQFLVQATSNRFTPRGKKEKEDWRAEGQQIIDDIYKSHKASPEEGNFATALTETERDTVKAIERNVSKLGFDVVARVLYWTEDHFRVTNIKGLLGIFRQYNSNSLNGFRPNNVTGFDYPWEDFKDIRATGRKKRLYQAYKKRGGFYKPFKRKPFVLNSEELATLFHFPGQVSETPTFGRIDSRKAEPPSNLPV